MNKLPASVNQSRFLKLIQDSGLTESRFILRYQSLNEGHFLYLLHLNDTSVKGKAFSIDSMVTITMPLISGSSNLTAASRIELIRSDTFGKLFPVLYSGDPAFEGKVKKFIPVISDSITRILGNSINQVKEKSNDWHLSVSSFYNWLPYPQNGALTPKNQKGIRVDFGAELLGLPVSFNQTSTNLNRSDFSNFQDFNLNIDFLKYKENLKRKLEERAIRNIENEFESELKYRNALTRQSDSLRQIVTNRQFVSDYRKDKELLEKLSQDSAQLNASGRERLAFLRRSVEDRDKLFGQAEKVTELLNHLNTAGSIRSRINQYKSGLQKPTSLFNEANKNKLTKFNNPFLFNLNKLSIGKSVPVNSPLTAFNLPLSGAFVSFEAGKFLFDLGAGSYIRNDSIKSGFKHFKWQPLNYTAKITFINSKGGNYFVSGIRTNGINGFPVVSPNHYFYSVSAGAGQKIGEAIYVEGELAHSGNDSLSAESKFSKSDLPGGIYPGNMAARFTMDVDLSASRARIFYQFISTGIDFTDPGNLSLKRNSRRSEFKFSKKFNWQRLNISYLNRMDLFGKTYSGQHPTSVFNNQFNTSLILPARINLFGSLAWVISRSGVASGTNMRMINVSANRLWFNRRRTVSDNLTLTYMHAYSIFKAEAGAAQKSYVTNYQVSNQLQFVPYNVVVSIDAGMLKTGGDTSVFYTAGSSLTKSFKVLSIKGGYTFQSRPGRFEMHKFLLGAGSGYRNIKLTTDLAWQNRADYFFDSTMNPKGYLSLQVLLTLKIK